MQKKLVRSSLALTAAAALGLGGAIVASPAAMAADQPVLTAQSAEKEAKSLDVVNAFGFEDGTLHLGVEKKSDLNADEIEALQEKYGADNVDVRAGVPEVEAQSAEDLVGGAGYIMQVPSTDGYAVCSTGFSGWDGQGNPVVLTAGHCAADVNEETGTIDGETDLLDTEVPSSAPAMGGETPELSGLGPVGAWGPNEYGTAVKDGETTGNEGDIDFAVIEVDDSAYNVKNGVADWKSDDLSSTASEITSVGAHTEGKIEKSGRTTGLTEGEVMSESQAPFDFMNVSGRWVHGFAVKSDVDDPFSKQGDSGGGVFQGETAVGVISGGDPSAQLIDEEGNPVGEPFAMGWVADLDYSLEAAGYDFNLTNPEDETPEAPASPAVEDQTIEPKGEVSGKTVANADVKVTWTGTADGEATAKADADGNFTVTGPSAEGAYDATAVATVDGQTSEPAAFKLTVEAADAPAAPEAPKAEDQTVDEGGQITGQAVPNADVKLSWAPAEDAGAQSGNKAHAAAADSTTVTADDSGKFTAEAPSEAGEYDYTATTVVDGVESDATEFTVTVEEAADEAEAAAAADGDSADADSGADSADANAEADADGSDSDAGAAADAKNAESNADSDGSKDGEAPDERTISIEPKEVAASDFVKEDKGVQITVEGFEEGENVSLEVVAGPENVEGITLDETANEDGVAAFSIYGTNVSDPSAYLGKYDVQVTGANDTDDEKALTGSFSVVANEDGNGGGDNGGGDDGDGGDGGSDLPRTGAELTGLAAGAGLLVVGGAAVVLTMRRNKKN